VTQQMLEHARRVRARAATTHARVLEVAEAVAVAEDRFAETMDRLAESHPCYTQHLRALGSEARAQAAAERRWATSYALINPLAGSSAGFWRLVDAFPDGVVVTDGDGRITLASRRLAEMFGYERGELIGQPVEMLIPAAVRPAHRRFRAGYARAPSVKLMDDRARLAGLRKDGTTVVLEISLSPVSGAPGRYTLAVIREASGAWDREGPVELSWSGAAALAHSDQELELLDRVVKNLFAAGMRLQGALGTAGRTSAEQSSAALRIVDDTVQLVRDHVLAAHASASANAGSGPIPR
jgi:PAS domain S-box-containing protein